MLAVETLLGARVVATPAAIDAMTPALPAGAGVLRFAPDEVLVLGVTAAALEPAITGHDAHAIVEDESGFSGRWFSWPQFDDVVRPHIEWSLPLPRPALAQGLVAFVPAKLWLTDQRVLLVCATAYADELLGRLK